MKVIILAAGIGSRLTPITQFKPKSMVKVNGKPILEYQIDGYIKAGISESDIYIVTGYMDDHIDSYIRRNYSRVHIVQNNDFRNTNNMYSLYLALCHIENKLGNLEQTIFISNADCVYSEKLMNDFVNCPLENAIAVDLEFFNEESMKIELDDNGHLTNIAKTISKENSNGISLDIYKYSKEAIRELFAIVKGFVEDKKELNHWTEVAFPHLFKKIKINYFDICKESWVEIDNFQDLAIADKLFSKFNLLNKKAIICDIDGTVFIGNTPIKGAIDFIEKNHNNYDFYFATNNTSKIPTDYVQKLAECGIIISERQVLTPLMSLIEYIKKTQLSSVYLIANDRVYNFLKQECPKTEFGFDLENNQALILTYDSEINYQKLKNASILLNKKQDIIFLATHTDMFCPTENGPIPDIGSFIKLISSTTNRDPDIIFGKPNSLLIEHQIKNYDISAVVLVGDRIYTDKKLADNVGCDFICVLSGETKRQDIDGEELFPSLILGDLGDLENFTSSKQRINFIL